MIGLAHRTGLHRQLIPREFSESQTACDGIDHVDNQMSFASGVHRLAIYLQLALALFAVTPEMFTGCNS